jgi:hypothetical protein
MMGVNHLSETAMTGKRTVSWQMAQEVQRMAEEKDRWGRRVWTLERLGDHFGISAATAGRIVNRTGPYRQLKAPKTDMEIEIEVAQIFKKTQEVQAGIAQEPLAGEEARAVREGMLKKEIQMPSAEALAASRAENERKRLEEEERAKAVGMDRETLVKKAHEANPLLQPKGKAAKAPTPLEVEMDKGLSELAAEASEEGGNALEE